MTTREITLTATDSDGTKLGQFTLDVEFQADTTDDTTDGSTDSGTSDGSTDDSTNDTTEPAIDYSQERLLTVQPHAGTSWGSYRIVVDGDAAPGNDNVNSGDTVTTRSDGTSVIEGGIGDKPDKPEGWAIWGRVMEATLSLDGHIEIDGQEVAIPEPENGTSDGTDSTDGSSDDGGTSDPSGALVRNSLDTMADVDDFFVETQTNRAKVDCVSSNPTPAEGSGSMRINQPSKQRSEEKYGGNEFYGTEGFHYLDERPEYPDDGLEQCHLRYWVMLDENYTIDNPWAGQQAGKGFPGFDGRWGRDASENPDPWLVNGAIWSADEIGGSADDWLLSFYLYDKKTNIGDSGRTYHPSRALPKGEWVQVDRFIDVTNNELRQWYDGDLVIDLDSSDVEFTPNRSPFDKLYAIRNLFYYGGGWGAPDGSGDNFAYIDDIQVFDAEQQP